MATQRTAPTRETTISQATAITGVGRQAERAEQPANMRADGLRRQGLPLDRQPQSQTASTQREFPDRVCAQRGRREDPQDSPARMLSHQYWNHRYK